MTNGPATGFLPRHVALVATAIVALLALAPAMSAADHDAGLPHSPGSPDRAFELVSPADKTGGQGVGFWYAGGLSSNRMGFAAHDNRRFERFAVQADYGATLTDGAYAFANDWALAQRTPTGWTHFAAASRGGYGAQNYRFLESLTATKDLSRTLWFSNAGMLRLFPEMERWDEGAAGNPAFVRDWSEGKWDLFGPTDPTLSEAPSMEALTPSAVALSSDGRFVLGSGLVRGIGGPTDPTYPGWPAPTAPTFADGYFPRSHNVYLFDISAGLTDAFPGPADTRRQLVNVCSAGTVIPARLATGKLSSQNCPPVQPGREASLISSRGASVGSPRPDRAVSRDGSRTWFMSPNPTAPDPDATGPVTPGLEACAPTLEGLSTSCPAQLYISQRGTGGALTRWVSQSTVANQDASLLRAALFEGASADGGTALFRTATPLTADDPNGGRPIPGGVTTGSASNTSNDLYSYEVPAGPDGDSATADGDPAGGTLTRISAGPKPLGFGTGDLTAGSSTVGSVTTSSGEFAVGQRIAGTGIPNNTTIAAIGPGTLTLTATATATATGVDLSAGVDGNVVVGVSTGVGTALGRSAVRFMSDDAKRVYFTTAAPLPGVPGPASGGLAAPAGTLNNTSTVNLYLYDATKPLAQRWQFVALLPRAAQPNQPLVISPCASTADRPGSALGGSTDGITTVTAFNCVRGTSDGSFITFWTDGRLTADDPDTVTGDVYGYDATAGRLMRLSAPESGADGNGYPCTTTLRGVPNATPRCHGDSGAAVGGLNTLGVVSDPNTPGDRVAFFQSASRLVIEDTDDAYDVYQWRNGDLSLVSTGDSDNGGAFYMGNDSTGRNVFFATRDQLTWEDHDAVFDVYSARLGGGFVQPEVPVLCVVLAHGCRSDEGAPPVPPSPSATVAPGGGDIAPGVRRRLALRPPGRVARRQAVRSGVLAFVVRASHAGPLTAVARARLGGGGRRAVPRRVASERLAIAKPGVKSLRLRLNRSARNALSRTGVLRLSIKVSQPGARARSTTVTLTRVGP